MVPKAKTNKECEMSAICWNYFFNGYNNDGRQYSGRYPISTCGCFFNGNEARYGSNIRTAVLGIPYDQELQDIDRQHFEAELARAETNSQRTAVQCAHIDQIWWRHLEARPVWSRLPAFIYAWLYVNIFSRTN